jgi:hypothetical protein
MQSEKVLSEADAERLIAAVSEGALEIYESYSEFEKPTRIFKSREQLAEHIAESRLSGKHYFTLAAHYDGTAGEVRARRIALVPQKCQGATWRETTEGWGLVSVQLTYEASGMVKCRVAANSQKRAVAWAATLERLGSPESWNWPVVEKHARRLIRKLKSNA